MFSTVVIVNFLQIRVNKRTSKTMIIFHFVAENVLIMGHIKIILNFVAEAFFLLLQHFDFVALLQRQFYVASNKNDFDTAWCRLHSFLVLERKKLPCKRQKSVASRP